MTSPAFRIISALVLVTTLAACSTFRFPGVHRIAIQQGNVVTQQMIDRLKPGMTQSQVNFVLGNAVISDPLNADRWDYIYSIQLPQGEIIRKNLTVYFVDGRLSYFVGDYIPTSTYEELKENSGE